MSSWLWIPIAIVIIGIVIAFPLWFTHRQMRDHHDLAAAEEYLDNISKSADEAATGQPAASRQDSGASAYSAPRGRHAAPEGSQSENSATGARNRSS